MSLNFTSNISYIISSTLKELNENQPTPRKQRIEITLLALKEIRVLASTKPSQLLLEQVNAKDLILLKSQLNAIGKIALAVGSPHGSPHKMKRAENERPHLEVSKEIEAVKQIILDFQLIKLNEALKMMTTQLQSKAIEHSNAIKKLIENYASESFSEQGYINTINLIVLNLAGLKRELIETTNKGLELATDWAEETDPKLNSSKNLEEFQNIILELITEYTKIADSLEFFQKQNDVVSTILSKINSSKIESFQKIEDNEDPLEVLEAYKRKILICKEQIENYKTQNKPEHILLIMSAISNLRHYLSQKKEMVRVKLEARKAYQDVLQEKYEAEVDEEKRLYFKEKLENHKQATETFEKASNNPIYRETQDLIIPVEFDLNHWLFPKIKFKWLKEAKNHLNGILFKGFKQYQNAIIEFRKQMQSVSKNEIGNGSVIPFIELQDKILNIQIPKMSPKENAIPTVVSTNQRVNPFVKNKVE